ncbi:MAG: phosphoribosylglycinamide formyltransferase [Candidatus Zixiibacteriota bacterium]
MADKARLAVFISGGGSNLQAIIDASLRGELSAEVAWVVSSTPSAYGLTRARNAGIEATVVARNADESIEIYGERLLRDLQSRRIDYIALAGYLKLLPTVVVRTYRDKIVNIHPALLPKHGGKGMYGHHVHSAVIAAGDKESGVTIHLVNEAYDEGRILLQVRVSVLADDTPETLAARILVHEHEQYPKVIDKLIRGEYVNR